MRDHESIVLDIEAIVLYGFDARQRHHIGDAVRRELYRLVLQKQRFDQVSGADVARLDADDFTVENAASAEHIGVNVAQAIYGALRWRDHK